MHASHAANSSRPSLCTTNLRHIHFPHTVPPTHPHPPQTRTHTRSHMRVALLSPLSHLSLPASHCFPRVTHNRSLHSPTRSPTLCVLDDVTALAHSLTHSLRARKRHCTHPLAPPLAACSKTSLHSPTRSPTHCVIDDVTTLAHSLTHSLRDRRRHYTHHSLTHRESDQATVVWWGSALFWTITGARGLWRETRQ